MIQDKEGNIQTQLIITGLPKANDEGIRSMLNWIAGTINPSMVQGNFPIAGNEGYSPKYEAYIEEYHIELITMLVTNAPDWEILDNELDGITAFIMLMVIPFFSRLIGNKERDSYGETMRTIESQSLQSKSGGLNLFKKS
jgi:hypothetical protein